MLKSILTLSLVFLCHGAFGYNLDELLLNAQSKRLASYADKRAGVCPPSSPFQCPGGDCIPIKYLCDGSSDCPDGYDEDDRMCTAAVRPPVADTKNFLNALVGAHGPNFLAKIFGPKANADAASLGGINSLAVALSESPTAEDFGGAVGLSSDEISHMKSVFKSAAKGGKAKGMSSAEASDFKLFAQQLLDTGF